MTPTPRTDHHRLKRSYPTRHEYTQVTGLARALEYELSSAAGKPPLFSPRTDAMERSGSNQPCALDFNRMITLCSDMEVELAVSKALPVSAACAADLATINTARPKPEPARTRPQLSVAAHDWMLEHFGKPDNEVDPAKWFELYGCLQMFVSSCFRKEVDS